VIEGGEDAEELGDDTLTLSCDVNLSDFPMSGTESLFAGASEATGRSVDLTSFKRIAFNHLFPPNPIEQTLLANGRTPRSTMPSSRRPVRQTRSRSPDRPILKRSLPAAETTA
jgi:hypothetical protein